MSDIMNRAAPETLAALAAGFKELSETGAKPREMHISLADKNEGRAAAIAAVALAAGATLIVEHEESPLERGLREWAASTPTIDRNDRRKIRDNMEAIAAGRMRVV